MDERVLTEPSGEVRSGSVAVDGGRLEFGVRGSGPSVLLLHGAGAQGLFDEAAEAMAGEFTVVTCGGGQRFRFPKGVWPPARVQRLADDAAAIIGSLGADPVAVYGHNSAAIVALELLLRHPGLVRGAALHEPPLVSVLDDPGPAMAQLDSALRQAAGGSPAMYAAFVGAQDPTLAESPHAALRGRLVANAGRFVPAEVEVLAGYRPDGALLARTSVPLLLVQGSRTGAANREGNRWLAQRARAAVAEVPGGHWSFLDASAAFVDAVGPFLRAVTGRRPPAAPRS